MKKIVSVLLIALGLGLLSYSPISAATNDSSFRRVEVNLNGEFIQMDVHPVIRNSRLYIPIRTFATLGFSYAWNPSTKITTIQNKEGDYLKITVNSQTAYKNEEPVQMDAPAKNIDGRVLVPIRFVTESLGYNVQYDSSRRIVFVTSKSYKFDMKMLNHDDLVSARRAAISLPITTDFKLLGVSGTFHEYSFPVGRADVYYLMDGRYRTFVEIKDGKAIAIGQFDENDRSRTAGKVPPNMIYDTDPIMEPYNNNGSVLFMENRDGTGTAAYNDENSKRIEFKNKINVYSDIIQPLPDQR